MDLALLSVLLQVVFLEGILSVDNAAVLGTMVSVLPTDEPVPLPKWLGFLEGSTERVFGMQQAAALKVGLLGAYIGRGLLLVIAEWVTRNPVLKIVGAVYLLWLALVHIGGKESAESAIETGATATAAFWPVVLQVELTDLVFSLDNVIAIVALSDKFWVIMLGTAVGILLMRFAASFFTKLLKYEPILETAAYLIVGAIGLELLLSQFAGLELASWQKLIISVSILLSSLVYAHVPFLQRVLERPLAGLQEVIRYLIEIIRWPKRKITELGS